MNVFSFLLLLILPPPLQGVNASSVSDGMPIDIYVNFREPRPTKGHIIKCGKSLNLQNCL